MDFKWTKFSDKIPWSADYGGIIYYDSKTACLAILYITFDQKYYSVGYFCNDPKCGYIEDTCNCEVIVEPDDCWMKIPPIPIDREWEQK